MAKLILPGDNKDQTVDEKNSTYIEFDLLDPNDSTGATKIPGSAVSVATLDLYNKSTGLSIFTARDVKASFNASGHFKQLLTGTENAIVANDNPQYEDHIAIVTATFSAGGDTHDMIKQIRVRVMNLQITT